MSSSDQGGRKHEARQGERQHIFAINHDPEFLDAVRVLLQDERFNVTTTNYVPCTWDQIAALQPSLLLVDVVPYSQTAWDLLEHLHAEGVTSRIPIVVTSTDRHLLERVQTERERYGGDRVITKPLDIDVLPGAIRALIDPA
jgi:DNA-binding response OmpR family regulator